MENEQKEKLRKWLSNWENLILLAVLVFAVLIRLYYFSLTYNQPLWWDEASYGSIAKGLLNPAILHAQVLTRELVIRPPFLPFVWSFFLRAGLSEAVFKFFLLLIPSILSVFLVYLITKEVSNKRIATLSTFLFSILWIHLFYSMRIMTETPALFFSLISVYYFIKSYKNNFKFKFFMISIFCLCISTLFRYPFGIVGFVFILFILLTGRFKLFTKKSFWISGILGGIPLFIFFGYNLLTKGALFPAATDYASSIVQIQTFAFSLTLGFIPHYLQTVLLVFFILGVVFCISELFLGFGLIRKTPKLENNLFMFLLLIITLAAFIFVIKFIEDRYLFICVVSFMYFTALGIYYIADFVKKYSKLFSIAFILLILILGAYQQLTFGDSMIQTKKVSYLQMKQAFTWIKQNSNPDDIMIVGGSSELFCMYYAERVAYVFGENATTFEQQISTLHPKYLVVHAFNPQPEYIYTYPQEHPQEFTPVQVFFFAENQPAVVIYKINENAPTSSIQPSQSIQNVTKNSTK